ncbi:MAG: hypothetical protein J2P37_00325 [Ktedonobacteraceae bacterium]|nr:hypothetical protein [Ktedonobacteraceae bacterium]
MKPHDQYHIIVFRPELECLYCHRTTTIAVLNPDLADSFEPLCPVHFGILPPPVAHRIAASLDVASWKEEAVRRFVLFACGNQVRIAALVSVPLVDAQLEGWIPAENDEVWQVVINISEGVQATCHVLWDSEELEYALYRDGKEVLLLV